MTLNLETGPGLIPNVISYFNTKGSLPKKDRNKKSRIREIKHLSTDADSSTDTTVGWTNILKTKKK